MVTEIYPPVGVRFLVLRTSDGALYERAQLNLYTGDSANANILLFNIYVLKRVHLPKCIC